MDGHRIEIDAEQTSLRDGPAHRRTLGRANVARVTAACADERGLVRMREVLARRDQERAAAHRGVEDLEGENPFGFGLIDQRPERTSNEVVCQRLRRVERTGRLALRRAVLQCDTRCRPAGLDDRFVIEQLLVDGTQLLDAQLAVSDALAAGTIHGGPSGEREHGTADRAVVEVAALGQRRAGGREQPAIEGGDAQVARDAAGVRHPARRAQRLPEARRRPRSFGRFAQ